MPHVGQLNLSLLLMCRAACRGCQQSKRSRLTGRAKPILFSSTCPLAVMAVVSRTSPQGLSSHQPGLPALCALRLDSAGLQQVVGEDKISGYFANYTLNSPWDPRACIQGCRECSGLEVLVPYDPQKKSNVRSLFGVHFWTAMFLTATEKEYLSPQALP